jgi:hypothetical protein
LLDDIYKAKFRKRKGGRREMAKTGQKKSFPVGGSSGLDLETIQRHYRKIINITPVSKPIATRSNIGKNDDCRCGSPLQLRGLLLVVTISSSP